MECLNNLINHPENIIRKPRFTQQEVGNAEAIKMIYPKAKYIQRGDENIKVYNDEYVIARLNTGLFPTLCCGEIVTLSDIIGANNADNI